MRRLLFFAFCLIVSTWIAVAMLKGDGMWSKEPALTYVTHKLQRQAIVSAVRVNGTLQATKVYTVGTQITGPVTKVLVDVNQRVTKGQLLAEIDPALLLAQIGQTEAQTVSARAAFELARRNASRLKILLNQGYASLAEWERANQEAVSAEASYKVSKAQLDRDKQNLSYAKVVSPADGVVISRKANEGQTIQASFQTPELFEIVGDLKQLELQLQIPEGDITKVSIGQEARFTVDAFSSKIFKGKVEKVNVSPTPGDGPVTFRVTVSVNNDDEQLYIGMTAYVQIVLGERNDALALPDAALRYAVVNGGDTSDGPEVFVLANGTPEIRKVSLGINNGILWEVTGGELKEGDLVVVREDVVVK